ncbi:MAG TPA: zf-HC2 domain-containing protein [Myxococcaceae bacterium]|nr:zf-HC2 domain-containing protein [Myxococcaceae bacterium]
MSCTVEDELTAYLDGELSVVEAARVRTHLASCADCRATEALLRRTVTELAALPAFEPSTGLRRRVLAEVEALPRPWPERLRTWLRPALLAPAGVAVATAVVVAVVAGQRVSAERRTELAVAEHYELLTDYEVVGLSRDDLDVVEHLDELQREGRP